MLPKHTQVDSDRESTEEFVIPRAAVPLERKVGELLQKLNLVIRRIQPFTELLSQTQAMDRFNIELPEDLPKAWLHLLISFACFEQDNARSMEQLDASTKLLTGGMQKVIQRPNQKSLLEYSIVTPVQLTSLINFNLLQDITRIHPDINTTYWEFMKSLVSHSEP